MKNIVVATDFSAAADNATFFAARLAQQTGGAITLVHIYQIPVSMNDVPVMMVSADELRNNAESGLQKTAEGIRQNFPELQVQTESRLGDVVDELNEICDGLQPLAIVVGKHGSSGVERLLFGTTATSVIRHAKFPVITVPDTTTQFQLRNIGLASDGTPIPGQEALITDFVSQVGARLHIVHIQERNTSEPAYKQILPGLQPQYHNIKDADFMHGMETFIQNTGIDMLMVLPHRHSFMERIFFKTHTAELVEKVQVPMMSIPGAGGE